ncbi:hypothetical protein EH264_18050 [Salmonella enterica]|uniref:Uncharacterized protein n=7 Tax=Salmonella enterica I TaxID=59201 RepID=A0A5I2MW01_SALET|nr:hypothetical protein EL006_20665 [Salmonella enterica subsp. enterica serovar Stanleyville]AZT73947.1 hypothetical protein ELZ91_19835 [Salmonella enterica subsp. enterica serovar Waycross]AZZ02978.1 hypothetical protein EOS97_12720 [Salmonella sp. SSDFZ54]EAA7668667.1 hypothetical protein [Salmonella enterica]EAA9934550.1 hypothetical protein [Salmonella enterica subsp. enterica serovar Schwarzengrund]EAB8340996.1 hypothetical protein [Salmonella enterica subsp. enterica serovar Abaetetuba
MGWRKKHWLWSKKCPVALRLPGLQYVHSCRPDKAPAPPSGRRYQRVKLPFVFRQLAQILENLTR